jgi:hypothetical protein
MLIRGLDTIKKNTETLIDANTGVGLEVNKVKTKCMLLSHHQNAGQTHGIKIANTYFENVAHLKYLGRMVTNQNLIQQVIKRRLNLGNACYHSVQNFLSFRVPSKNVIMTICKTIILPVVLHEYETWSLTSREEHILRVRTGC